MMRFIRYLVVLVVSVANAAQPVYRAEDFVESLGLAASPFERYLDSGRFAGAGTKYPPEFFFDLGIRYYRSSLRNDLVPEDQAERVTEWWRKTGARPLLLIDPGKTRTVQADWMNVPADGDFSYLLEELKRYPAGVVAGVEGPNELNNKFPPQELNLRYRGEVDEVAGALYQRDLSAALRADPATRGIPLIAFTSIFSDYQLAHPCEAFDLANMHSYQGSAVPSSSLLMNMTRFNNILPAGATIRPFHPTEAGYNVEEDKTNQQGFTGSLRAQAMNIPLLYAEYFRHGIPRTYLFALHNADGYGLLESDQETKRPSWFAVQSFVRILADSRWNPESLQWEGGRDFTPRALRFQIEGAPPTVHSLCLQKENGDWFLLIWNELQNFRDGRDVENPAAPVTIRFGDRTPVRTVAMFEQNRLAEGDGAFQAVEAPPEVRGNALALDLPSRIVILQLRAEGEWQALKDLPAPVLAAGEVTENRVEVVATLPADHGATDVLLFRNDMLVAALPASETVRWSDDSAWVRGGLGYRYAAQTVAACGSRSPRVEKVVVTADRRPDLVVGEFGPQNAGGSASLRPGDEVLFEGEFLNVGDGATPNPAGPGAGMYNSSVSITFRIDGEVVSWGGSGERSYAPGERGFLEGLGGPRAKHTWRATEGTHLLTAAVDDINRINNERNQTNNIASRTLTVGDFPGVLSLESRPGPGEVNLAADGTLDRIHFTEWKNETTPPSAAGLLGPLKPTGHGHVAVTDGAPVAIITPEGRSHRGLWRNGVGGGWEFDVAASENELRTLRLYVAGLNGARGKLTASLSDNSAPDAVCASWNGNRGQPWAAVPDGFSAVYTLRFRAAAPDARLRVRWEMESEPNRHLGQIRLQAATLGRE